MFFPTFCLLYFLLYFTLFPCSGFHFQSFSSHLSFLQSHWLFPIPCKNSFFPSSAASGRQRHPTPVPLPGQSHGRRSLVGCSPWGCEESDMTERLHFHALEKEMATHSSVLAWRIPGMGEPGGLPSMGSHRVGHD